MVSLAAGHESENANCGANTNGAGKEYFASYQVAVVVQPYQAVIVIGNFSRILSEAAPMRNSYFPGSTDLTLAFRPLSIFNKKPLQNCGYLSVWFGMKTDHRCWLDDWFETWLGSILLIT